jgi:MOSC domain-containing protein YiiM
MSAWPVSTPGARPEMVGMAEVLHLYICLVHRFPMEEVESAEAIQDKGLKGCIHGRPGSKRQILLMDRETLDAMGIAVGAVKENITMQGLDFQALQPGERLKIGEATLEITIPCDPCSRMNEIREGLEQELRGRRGWLCRVVAGGKIARGDRIELQGKAQQVAN